MKVRHFAGPLLVVLLVGGLCQSQAPSSDRVQALIEQLGSRKFANREQASKELDALGTAALPGLIKASEGNDLETSRRAKEIIRRIEERTQVANILAPKKVRLNLKETPVLDAVKELSQQSGYPITVEGDRTIVAAKKITLDTGDTTFWQALDLLCAKAGLVERVNTSVNPLPTNPYNPRPPIRVRPPIRIQPVPLPAIPANPPQAVPLPAPQLIPLPAIDPALPAPDAPPRLPPGANKPLVQPGARANAVRAVAQAQVGEARPAVQPAPQQPPAPPQAAPAPPAPPPLPQQPPLPPAIQIQVAPIPPQPPIGGFGGGFGGPMVPNLPPANIQLVPGSAKKQSSYAGAVRVQAHALPVAKGSKEIVVILEASAEPRLQGFTLVGTPTIEKAVDDQGQTLKIAMPESKDVPPAADPALPPNIMIGAIAPNPMGMVQRQMIVKLAAGEKPTQAIKELVGTVSAQVQQFEALATLDNVTKAAGQSAKGKNGGELRLKGIDKLANGDYRVQVEMDNLTPNPFGGQMGNVIIQGAGMIQIQGNVVIGGNALNGGQRPDGTPDLVDAKGQKYTFAGMPSNGTRIANGQFTRSMTILFRPAAGQGEPTQLIYNGARAVTVPVPIRFENIPVR